ncbi:hypothetical protein MKW94_003318, partial [Papaver nudicaule]|nr:hypothetical protein [Papaver nudicaule]
TVQFSASTYVTSHSFLLELGTVRQDLDDWQESHDDPFLSHMDHVMLLKYNKYWGEYKKMNPLMFIASYKLEYLNVGGVASSQESVGDTSSTQSGSSCNSGRIKYLDKRLKRKSQLSSVDDHGKSELERYLIEKEYSPTNANSVFDILQWWKLNAARFEVLPLIAKDIFAIPISSVASESAFSTGKRILDPFRSSLKLRTLQSLILLQNWIRTPIYMDPSTLGVEEEEIDSLESGIKFKLPCKFLLLLSLFVFYFLCASSCVLQFPVIT